MLNTIKEEFSSHLETINNVIGSMEKDIETASTIIVDALKNGIKYYFVVMVVALLYLSILVGI